MFLKQIYTIFLFSRHDLQEFACYATKVEDNCGTVAMDAFVEIVQMSGPVAPCGRIYDYLQTIIRIYKLEKEQANEVADVFKKKK